MHSRAFILLSILPLLVSVYCLRATVFGATGGVGQLICAKLLENKINVKAVSRQLNVANFPLLNGCEFAYADARNKSTLRDVCGSDLIVISVGTTAFPTKKWANGNDPNAACFQTVENILDTVASMTKRPNTIALLSSIGVDRTSKPPFSILNLYGVLDAKKRAEDLLEKRSSDLKINSVIVRPGRLVGEPFTNFDLAKLLKLEQGKNCGITLDPEDSLAGDVERNDVADAVVRTLLSLSRKGASKNVKFSMINKPGMSPTNDEWEQLLSPYI